MLSFFSQKPLPGYFLTFLLALFCFPFPGEPATAAPELDSMMRMLIEKDREMKEALSRKEINIPQIRALTQKIKLLNANIQELNAKIADHKDYCSRTFQKDEKEEYEKALKICGGFNPEARELNRQAKALRGERNALIRDTELQGGIFTMAEDRAIELINELKDLDVFKKRARPCLELNNISSIVLCYVDSWKRLNQPILSDGDASDQNFRVPTNPE